MKHLNFTVSETTERTFDLPLDKAVELIKELKANDEFLQGDEVDLEDSKSIAEFFAYNNLLDELLNFEKYNDYVESEVVENKIYEDKE